MHLSKDKKFAANLEGAWPAIWQWIHFLLDRCIEEIKKRSDFSSTFMNNCYETCVLLLDYLANDAHFRLTIATTSGVIHTLAEIWITEAKNQNGFPGYSSSIALVNFLTPESQYASCITSFLETSGGDPAKLAATCLGRIIAIRNDPTPDLHALDADVRIIISISNTEFRPYAIRKALIQQQSFAIISQTMYGLAVGARRSTSPIMFSCLTFCAAYLRDYKDTSSYMILDALESELIPALLLSGRWLIRDSASTILRDIRCEMMGDILPRYLIFQSILQEARRSLKWIRKCGFETQDILEGQFGQAWTKFKYSVRDRLAIEAHSPLYVVCENPAVSHNDG
jgi:hypothetical protein